MPPERAKYLLRIYENPNTPCTPTDIWEFAAWGEREAREIAAGYLALHETPLPYYEFHRLEAFPVFYS